MIPFDELSLALAAWRVKNDLPITEQDQNALQAVMGAAAPPPPPIATQDYSVDEFSAADVGQEEVIADYPPPVPTTDGMPPPPPGADEAMPMPTEAGMSEEMQITDSQLVSADEVPAPELTDPDDPGDFDIDLDD